jgi:hypothetical protein
VVDINYVIRNDSDRTIYHQYCSERISRRTEDARWTIVWTPVCPAIYVPPAPKAPGESREFDLYVAQVSNLSSAFPHLPGDVYRIGVGLMVRIGPPGSEEFEPIRASQSVSKTFRVSE